MDTSILQIQKLDISIIKTFEHQLEDVMEIIDKEQLKAKLKEVEKDYSTKASEINTVRKGIIYHETALNLSFFSNTEYKGYAKKSFDILSMLYNSSTTTRELLPFISSYQASALALMASETNNLIKLFQSFSLFDDAVRKYADISYLPEFMRGSVAENIPKIFFWLHKYGKIDFQSIIDKYNLNNDYANRKIMSFTYWAWAKQRQDKRYVTQAKEYLERAITLDPNYQAGRQRSEQLLKMFREKY
ncbi:hypothetical protein [Dysgonomonas macrotermitis]|uniref:Tetratricopeptide repeat-containing protein n=1 Tax=Dysgonomonas macrotermitis TaxID=1346286 RepID=A0A1M5EH75_9BACT|nr:hypothetical protein [Dysgonomonas macrotermitis]SHF78579.1 hypothetical protein SAMN05444362_11035 [Dysgonomonas macrotermitis]